jgi:hypothetical protein
MKQYEKYFMIAEALDEEANDMQEYRDLGLPFYYKKKEIKAIRDAADRFRDKSLLERCSRPKTYEDCYVKAK